MITCPRCGKTSYNKMDEIEQYCGNCHMYHADMLRCPQLCGWRGKDYTEIKIHIQLRHQVVNDR